MRENTVRAPGRQYRSESDPLSVCTIFTRRELALADTARVTCIYGLIAVVLVGWLFLYISVLTAKIGDGRAPWAPRARADARCQFGLSSPAPRNLLLHTTGAKTGQARTAWVSYSRDGDTHLIVASNGGDPGSRCWY